MRSPRSERQTGRCRVRVRALAAVLTSLLTLAHAGGAVAGGFLPISAEERALTEIPQIPGAPAIVLFKKAEVRLMDYPKEASSYLKVSVRLKILTTEGTSYGEAEIPHSGYYRLKNVEGRTVLPDGRIVLLSKESIFEERRSRSLRSFVTKLVFPAVEAGAILDYQYTVRWDSLFYLEPWQFHEEIPTRLSEITYIKPANLALQPWAVQRGSQRFQTETKKTRRGSVVRVWAENLPGIPQEPYRFPFADLSSRIMLIPKAIRVGGGLEPLLDTWAATCQLYLDSYKSFKRDDGKARKQTLELVAGIWAPAERAEVIHAFVRDEIQTEPALGVAVPEEATADAVLADLRGTPLEKALLLQVMLKAANVDSDLVWVFDRTNGQADLEVANPWWFDAALVRIDLDGQKLYLDPVDRSVGFGWMAPYYEGTRGVVVKAKRPEIVDIPVTPFSRHVRRAVVKLAVDAAGRITGTGTLDYEGHEAWRYLRWKQDRQETLDAWQEKLEKKYPGFDVRAVEVAEEIRNQRLRVAWSLSQRDEEVLGDEAAVNPTRPIGPSTQPFPLQAEHRKTPALMLYGKRDDLSWTLTWPEGWRVDVLPKGLSHGGPVGALEWEIRADEPGRRLTVERRFDLSRNQFVGLEAYRAVRDLYEHASRTDAQSVVLVRD